MNYNHHFKIGSMVCYVNIKSPGDWRGFYTIRDGIHGKENDYLTINIDKSCYYGSDLYGMPDTQAYEWVVANNSKGELVQYCPDDLAMVQTSN